MNAKEPDKLILESSECGVGPGAWLVIAASANYGLVQWPKLIKHLTFYENAHIEGTVHRAPLYAAPAQRGPHLTRICMNPSRVNQKMSRQAYNN